MVPPGVSAIGAAGGAEGRKAYSKHNTLRQNPEGGVLPPRGRIVIAKGASRVECSVWKSTFKVMLRKTR
jgi:hypothetical protein